MDLDVVFAGTGGSVPSARRGLPALLLRRGGERLLFDCGEGTQRQLLRSVGLPDIDAVFLTHHHADHWLGLPGMLKSFDLRDRHAPLDVFGPPGTTRLLESLRGVFGRTGYPLTFTDLGAGDAIEYGGYEVQAFNVRHRGTAFGYSIVEHERPGRFDADRARSLGVEEGPDFGRLQHGESVAGVSPEQVVGPTRAGRRIVISGDTAPCDIVRAAAQGADLLVHEATFTSDDAERAQETGHSTAAQAAEIALESGVRLLALTHVSSRYAASEIKDEAAAIFEAVVVPRDFDAVELPLPEKGEPRLVPWDRAARLRHTDVPSL
jgi:ribonuclease Z